MCLPQPFPPPLSLSAALAPIAAADWGCCFLPFSHGNCLWPFEATDLPLPRIQGGSCPELASGASRLPKVGVHFPARHPLPACGPKEANLAPPRPQSAKSPYRAYIRPKEG